MPNRLLLLLALATAPLAAQSPSAPNPAAPSQTSPSPAVAASSATPIALIRLTPDLTLAGSLTVTGSRAAIGSSGSVTAGPRTARITLPGRGHLSLCASTRATFTANPQHTSADHSGLMLSLDHGAVETDFRTGQISDVILTPDFRILISGPGQSTVQVRLADHGDTCVDNHGKRPPYVTVTSLFTGQAYRVQPNQRVLFQHGSVSEVVDNESESCGCPPDPTRTLGSNAFPVAQSAGLAPLPSPPPNATEPGVVHAQATAALRYNGATGPSATAGPATAGPASPTSASATSASASPEPPAPPATQPATAQPATNQPATRHPKRPNALLRLGHFFHRLFGAG